MIILLVLHVERALPGRHGVASFGVGGRDVPFPPAPLPVSVNLSFGYVPLAESGLGVAK